LETIFHIIFPVYVIYSAMNQVVIILSFSLF